MRPTLTRRTLLVRLAACSIPLRVTRASHAAPPRLRRIGLAFGDDPEGGVPAFRRALRERGHIEGENLLIDARTVPRASAAELVGEMVRADVELVVVHSLPLALMARQANPAMPLVVVTTPGFVSNGFAKTLEHPGGNVTGIDELPPGVTARRLELLKRAAPGVSRVALLSTTPGRGGHETQLADAEAAAARLAVEVRPYRAASLPELEEALARIAADQMNGLLNFQGALSFINRRLIVDFAAKHRLAAIYQATVFADAGGLMAWAPDLVEQFRMAADYVDRILKGARPADLPIRHPPRYYLTLNGTAARNLGLSFPEDLRSEADRILP